VCVCEGGEGGGWSRTHQCEAAVQLNVLQEVCDLFNHADTHRQEESVDVQLFLAISEPALSGKEAPRTLKIRGFIQDIQIMLLPDSGTSHSFVSEHVFGLLQGVTTTRVPTKVKVANGQILQSNVEILNVEWFIHGCAFISDLRVLPLQKL
jgi:hypothetical protein